MECHTSMKKKKEKNFWVLPKASSQKHAKWRKPDPKQLYAVWLDSHELLRWTAAGEQRCTQRNQSGAVMIQMEKSKSGWLQRWWELVQFWKYVKKKKSRCRFLQNFMQYARSKEMKLTGSEQKERWNFCWFEWWSWCWCRLGEGLPRLACVQSEMPIRCLNKGSKPTTGCAR